MKVIAVVLVVLALTIGIVPQFTDCLSQGKSMTTVNGMSVPMKCHWTAIAEISIAVTLGITGALLFVSKRKETRLVLSVLAAVLGLFAIAVPTMLIGVCSGPMLCNLVMSPVLIFSGIIVVVASIISLVLAVRQKETAQ